MRYILFILILFSNVTRSETSSLVDLFCGMLQSEVVSPLVPEQWEYLSLHLSQRETSLSIPSNQEKWVRCQSEYREFFEEAEFILSGRENVELSVKMSSNHSPPGNQMENLVNEEKRDSIVGLEIAPDLEIQAGKVMEEASNLSPERLQIAREGAESRREVYEALWVKFIESLKKKVLTSSF